MNVTVELTPMELLAAIRRVAKQFETEVNPHELGILVDRLDVLQAAYVKAMSD